VIPAQRSEGRIDPPLTVLWLIKGLGAGGAERLLVEQARHRDPEVVEPAVAYLLPGKSDLAACLDALGCRPVRCLGARSSWDPRWVVRLRRLLRSDPFALIHIHSPLVAVGARLVARTLPRADRPRIVVTEHNVWASHAPLTRAADRLTAGRAEIHLAVSEAVRASLPPAIRAGTRVVRYGIDTAAIRAGARRSEARAALGAGDDEIVIGTVANLRAT
jgi:hypothetical protein